MSKYRMDDHGTLPTFAEWTENVEVYECSLRQAHDSGNRETFATLLADEPALAAVVTAWKRYESSWERHGWGFSLN